MAYSWEEKQRLFEALGYQRRIQTQYFGAVDYPVPEVQRFHQSEAKIKIVLAPARTSKSYAAAYDMTPDILDFDRAEKHLIVGPDYDKASKEFGYIADALVHNRKAASEALGAEIPEPLEYTFKPHQGRMRIVWPWGAELHAKSAVHLSSVLGESWGVVNLSEACELQPETFYRGLRTRARRFIIPTTPGLAGMWVKELWEDAQRSEDPGTQLFHFPPEANPLYDMKRYKEELRRCGVEDPYFREQFLGEWVFYGGRVFPAFQPDPVEEFTEIQVREWGRHPSAGHHCVELDPLWIPQSWKRIAGMDFGWADPTAHLWAAVAPNGDVIIYDEYGQTQRSTEQHAAAIHQQSQRNGSFHVEDRLREPKGQAAQIARDYMTMHGLWSRATTNADRLSSRLHMQAYLDRRHDTNLPSLRIVKSRCPGLVKELIGLHYENTDEQPREGRVERWRGADHFTDCARYLLSSRPSPRVIHEEADEYAYRLDVLRKKRHKLARLHGQIGHGRPGANPYGVR